MCGTLHFLSFNKMSTHAHLCSGGRVCAQWTLEQREHPHLRNGKSAVSVSHLRIQPTTACTQRFPSTVRNLMSRICGWECKNAVSILRWLNHPCKTADPKGWLYLLGEKKSAYKWTHPVQSALFSCVQQNHGHCTPDTGDKLQVSASVTPQSVRGLGGPQLRPLNFWTGTAVCATMHPEACF